MAFNEPNGVVNPRRRLIAIEIPVVAAVLAVACWTRLPGLGARSLWLDEFATWHVSRMPFGESLAWGPELTKPPLYQVVLRGLSEAPRPSEAVLRAPAAVAGILLVAAGYWLGRLFGGRIVAASLSGLLAGHLLSIAYSREARAYSMLALGCVIATGFWYRLCKPVALRTGQERSAAARAVVMAGYVVTASLAYHAHYLAILTIAAHALWWVVVLRGRPMRAGGALAAVAVMCAPITIHFAVQRSSAFQGLGWIAQPTLSAVWSVFGELSFGSPWLVGLFLPAVMLLILAQSRWPVPPGALRDSSLLIRMVAGVRAFSDSGMSLLVCWLICAAGGLLVFSLAGQPLFLARYALPASVPLLLIPLIVARGCHQFAPAVVAAVVMAGTAPEWLAANRIAPPGFREMVAYVRAHAEPEREVVVQVIDNATYPGWEDMERLGLEYYPLEGFDVRELHLQLDGRAANPVLFEDPRGMYVMVFRADPMAVIRAAGRRVEPFVMDGVAYSQLLFEPYRLVKVAGE